MSLAVGYGGSGATFFWPVSSARLGLLGFDGVLHEGGDACTGPMMLMMLTPWRLLGSKMLCNRQQYLWLAGSNQSLLVVTVALHEKHASAPACISRAKPCKLRILRCLFTCFLRVFPSLWRLLCYLCRPPQPTIHVQKGKLTNLLTATDGKCGSEHETTCKAPQWFLVGCPPKMRPNCADDSRDGAHACTTPGPK